MFLIDLRISSFSIIKISTGVSNFSSCRELLIALYAAALELNLNVKEFDEKKIFDNIFSMHNRLSNNLLRQ
jgi:hypothetical protein